MYKENSFTSAGFEHTTSGAGHRRSNQLSYKAKLEVGRGN